MKKIFFADLDDLGHGNKPKMAYSCDPFLETTERDWRERLERERERETSKIQEMDLWQMADARDS